MPPRGILGDCNGRDLVAFGSVRDQTIAKGEAIFAKVRAFPSHLQALVVCSAYCLSHLGLKARHCDRLAKKVLKAV